MKIKVTEIECNAEELKNSRTVADGILDMLRGVFNTSCYYEDIEENKGETE